MDQTVIFGRLALAFGIGLMIGIERGWQSRAMEQGTRPLGVRTFSLVGLLGGILGLIGLLTTDAVAAVGAVGFVGFILVIYFTGLKKDGGRGATTEVAAILTLMLGIVAVRGDMEVAAAAGVLVTAILGIKKPLHHWIEQIDRAELTAAIKLLVISVVILPILPNKEYGPGGVINPFVLWWIVVVIAAISFAAYASIRLLGEKVGPAAVGLLGGLVSSTATTISFARFAKTQPSVARYAAGGIALASAVMFVRALVLTGVLFQAAIALLWLPLIAASLTSVVIAGVLNLGAQRKSEDGPLDLKASADLGTGLKFVLAFVAVALATEYAREFFGSQGALVASALGGLVDIDATNATMARLGAGGAVSVVDVATAVIVAASVNSIAKWAYAATIAGGTLLRLGAVVFVPPVAVAGIVFAIERQV